MLEAILNMFPELSLLEWAAQSVVLVSGVTALWLVGSALPKTRMLAGYIGLLGEPGWFYTTISNEQWLVAGLACVYTFQWLRIIRNNRIEYRRLSFGIIK